MSDVIIGYLCCVVSVLGFGSNYIPVKRVDVRDGVFFSFCLTLGVLLTGLVQWAAFGFYKFEPFAMLGGAIWAVGNACVPFIIQRCGLGQGQLVWSVTNMATGWATGTFGLFGKEKDSVQYFTLNVIGVCVSVLSLVPFTFMKEEDPRDVKPEPTSGNLGAGLNDGSGQGGGDLGAAEEGQRAVPNTSVSSGGFIAGFVVALIAGVFMGSNFDPPTYLQQIGPPKHSGDSMDYVISHFCGIVAATAVYLGIYVVSKGQDAFLGKEVIGPGLIAGIGWGIAQIGWFKANTVLSYVIAFPIIVATPGVLAAIWGIILFGENKGRRNLILLSCVIGLQIVGVSLIAVSKGNGGK